MTFNHGVPSSNLGWVTKNYQYADVAELADALDLGSSVHTWGFKSLHPHQLCGSGSVVERHLAKVNVASSNLVSRSTLCTFSSVGRATDS